MSPLEDIISLLPKVDQTNIIQSMARYMNEQGSSSEWMTLLLIFGGMAFLILCLSLISYIGRRKREKIRRAQMEKRRIAKEKASLEFTKKSKRTLQSVKARKYRK